MIWYFIGIAVCIAMSGFFSASEMAYSSANRMRLENARDAGSKKAGVACRIEDKYDDALSAILIGNNLVNIASSSLGSVIAILLAGEGYTAVATVIITILVIIFGETVPKIVSKKNANRFAIQFAYIVRGLTFILKPVVFLVVGAVHLITGHMKGEKDGDDQEAAVEELQSIIETVEDEGVIDEDRSELLQAALDFSDISASEVMTSRVDMVAIDIDDDWDEILEIIDNAPYSRLPVYENSLDNIIGILYLNHFFKAAVDGGRVDIRSLLMEPCHIYRTVKLPAVLSQLKKARMHMAIVVDEYGGCMGVITMEDVLEQLVGEIWDETDEVENEIVERPDGEYDLDGDMSISDFLELMEWDEDSFDFESATVGGWTVEMFGSFPKEGDSFNYKDAAVTVLKMDGLRVDRVLVRREKPKTE